MLKEISKYLMYFIGILWFFLSIINVGLNIWSHAFSLPFYVFFSFTLLCIFISLTHIKISTNTKKIFFCILINSLFFVVQLNIAWSIHFKTDWDSGTVADTAYQLAFSPELSDCWYVSVYPNNCLIIILFSYIYRILSMIQISNLYFGLQIIMVIIVHVSAYLVALLSYFITRNYIISIISMVIFNGLIGLSPWIIIPYSDIMVIPVPLIILILWYLSKCNRPFPLKVLCWIMISIISVIGYHLKPTSFILAIAIIIYEILNLGNKNSNFKQTALLCAFCAFAFFVTNLCLDNYYISIFSNSLDKDSAMPPTHFMMMGLKGYGGWNAEDYQYTLSINGYSEKIQANLNVIVERLKNYGIYGYIKFLIKKYTWTISDATFFWGKEGTFFSMTPYPDTWYKQFWQALFLPDGSLYSLYVFYANFIWTFILTVSCFNLIFKDTNKFIFSIKLAIIGLTIYLLVFETRSRYLIQFSSLYVIMAACGIWKLNIYLCKSKRKQTLSQSI